MSVIICSVATAFAKSFVPEEVRRESIQYVRISSFSAFFSAMDVSVTVCTRTLDRYVMSPETCGTTLMYTDRTYPS